MRDRKPEAFRCKGKSADGACDGKRTLAFPGLHECGFPGRPCDGAVRAQRNMVDPFSFFLGDRLRRAFGIGFDEPPVVAGGDDPFAVAHGLQNSGIGMRRNSVAVGKDQFALAARENRMLAQKRAGDDMHTDLAWLHQLGDGTNFVVTHRE
jgi:hypothetical protein